MLEQDKALREQESENIRNFREMAVDRPVPGDTHTHTHTQKRKKKTLM